MPDSRVGNVYISSTGSILGKSLVISSSPDPDSSNYDTATRYGIDSGGIVSGSSLCLGNICLNQTELTSLKSILSANTTYGTYALANNVYDKTTIDNKFYTKNTIKSMLNNSVPIGTVIAYASSTIPSGFLKCDGSYYSTVTYKKLFDVIGYTYGGTSTSTAGFKVPNIMARTIIGSGGTVFTSVTNNIGSTGGTNYITLTNNELPTHNHTGTTSSTGAHSHTGSTRLKVNGLATTLGGTTYNVYTNNTTTTTDPIIYSTNTTSGTHSHDITTEYTGLGNPFSNVQPFITLNYIIKYDDPSYLSEPITVLENYTHISSPYFGVF